MRASPTDLHQGSWKRPQYFDSFPIVRLCDPNKKSKSLQTATETVSKAGIDTF